MLYYQLFFVHPNSLVQNPPHKRKREPSPERGRKNGPGAVDEEEEEEEEEEEKEAPGKQSRDIPTLWRLLCLGKIKCDKRGDHKYLICPKGACWSVLDMRFAVKKLLIRKCYHRLGRAWYLSQNNVEMISGTSGIGKSMLIWCVLFVLMKPFLKDPAAKMEPLTFLWVTQTGPIYILHSDGSYETRKYDDEFPRSVDYCFIDVGLGFKLPHGLSTMNSTKTLIIASSDSERDGLQLLKQANIVPGERRFMPIWPKEDIKTVAKSLFGTALNRKKLHAIFLIFGGSLTSCLYAYMFADDGVAGNAPMSTEYYKASTDFVKQLKTSLSLASDGIPKLVDGLLKTNYIMRQFGCARFAYGEKVDASTLRNACSLIAHTISSAPKYTDGKLRLSSQFAALFVESFVKPKVRGVW